MAKTLRFTPTRTSASELLMIDKIVRISKKHNTTYIHLTNGEVIECEESLLTIEARLNKEVQRG